MTTPGFAPLAPAPLPYGSIAPDGAPVGAVVDVRRPVDPTVFVTPYSRPLPHPAEVFAGPGYESKPLPTSAVSVAALVCGILGVFTLVPSLAAIALGHVGLHQTARHTHLGRGLAIGGLVLGYAVAVVVLLVMLALWIAGQ